MRVEMESVLRGDQPHHIKEYKHTTNAMTGTRACTNKLLEQSRAQKQSNCIKELSIYLAFQINDIRVTTHQSETNIYPISYTSENSKQIKDFHLYFHSTTAEYQAHCVVWQPEMGILTQGRPSSQTLAALKKNLSVTATLRICPV